MSIDRQTCGEIWTIKDRGDENAGEIGLLLDVQIVRDLWSIRIIRPGFSLEIKHGPGEEGRIISTSTGLKWGEGVSRCRKDLGARWEGKPREL